IDGEEILARIRGLPLSTWNYIAEGRQVRHIGPMAQDWHRAFGLNEDDRTINSGDFDGVNLAAIQALEARTAELRAAQAQLAEKSRKIDELEARLARIEALLRQR
ncbi:MAG TPA: tail fiber domain-containing protein, partial [Longimicrobium sp.]|nr:tail fiber domain-containing protein [Longimicrobium sp.]